MLVNYQHQLKLTRLKMLLLCLVLSLPNRSAGQHRVRKVWETDTTLAHPESVLYNRGVLYVSLIDGEPLAADGKGAVVKMNEKGAIINSAWVTGLNAPKGMCIWKNSLYVSDLTKVVVINTLTGTIESTIPVPGSAALNDITIDRKGSVYVSDPETGVVYRIANGKVEAYVSNLKGVGGLKAVDDDLYILTDDAVLKMTIRKKFIHLAKLAGPDGDGLEPVGTGEFIITRHTGLMYYLTKKGTLQTLLDTRAQKKSAADIGYNASQRTIYVPTLSHNTVAAYQLH